MVDYKDDDTKYENEETNRKNEYSENRRRGCDSNYDCECCQCKRIFMMLVVLILVFITGIMVGNCRHCHYSDNYYYSPRFTQHHGNKSKSQKFHRGMQKISPAADNTITQNRQEKPSGIRHQTYPNGNTNSQTYPNGRPYPENQTYPDGQIGGFIIEVDQEY